MQLPPSEMIRLLSIVALALAPSKCAHAAEIVGRVVGVSDGDTITVLDAAMTLHAQKNKPRRSGCVCSYG